MSLDNIQLWKVIRLLGMDRKQRLTALRNDARETVAKEGAVGPRDGRDFYDPLWSDIKTHTLRGVGLKEMTALRIRANPRCKKRYLAASNGYLKLYPEVRNLFNGPIQSVTGAFVGSIDVSGCRIKCQNFMSLASGVGTSIHFYPYLFVEPSLSETRANYGLSILQRTVGTRSKGRIVIVDAVRYHLWYLDQDRDYTQEFEDTSAKIARFRNEWLELLDEYRKKAA